MRILASGFILIVDMFGVLQVLLRCVEVLHGAICPLRMEASPSRNAVHEYRWPCDVPLSESFVSGFRTVRVSDFVVA